MWDNRVVMPPRYAYWTILIDGKPTAFRAREKDELLPTFNQLQRKNKDIVFKWFARGRLWETPEEAHAAAQTDILRHRAELDDLSAALKLEQSTNDALKKQITDGDAVVLDPATDAWLRRKQAGSPGRR